MPSGCGRRSSVSRCSASSLGIRRRPTTPRIGQQIKDSGAQSVYLGGIVCNNGVKLLKDIRSVVGSKPVFVGSGRLDAVFGYSRGRLGR